MKPIIASAVILFSVTSGCVSQSPKVLAEGIEAATKEIFSEYEQYVIEGIPRPSFTEADKEIRRNSLKKARELIAEGKKD